MSAVVPEPRLVSRYWLADEELRAKLVHELRKILLVSDQGPYIFAESEPFQSTARGVFGFGPRWQERLVCKVVVLSRLAILLDPNSLGVLSKQDGPVVVVYVTTFERQGPEYEWRMKDGQSTNQALERSLLSTIQSVASLGSPM